MNIKQDIQNKLLKRHELEIELESEKNPTFADLKKQISKKISKPEENIDVYSIKGSFGKNKFKVKANIYDSRQDLENIKKLELTKKQRKEASKPVEEGTIETEETSDNAKSEDTDQADKEREKDQTSDSSADSKDKEVNDKPEDNKNEKPAKKSTDSAPVEDKPEQIEEKPEQKPTEAPVEERPEQEEKAVKEEKQAEEEAKEP